MSNSTVVKPAERGVGLVRRSWLVPVLFVLPAVVTLLAITIFPLLYEIRLAFVSWELTVNAPPQFIWFKNFVDILTKDGRFWNAMKNTTMLIFFGVGVQLILGTGLALVLNRLGRIRTFVTSLFLIPVMIAPVVAGMQWTVIYNDKFGPLNYIIQLLSGFKLHGFAWLANPKVALISIMITDVWQWTPFMILIVLAGLQSIPVELYEAAEVDGSSGWQSLLYITLPLLVPILVIGVLIRVMDSFKLFDLIYLLTNGGPGSTTETVSFYTYLQGFKFFSLGYTAALAFVQLIIITIIAQIFVAFQERQAGRG